MSRVASETARLARIGGEDRQRRGVAASASASSVSRRSIVAARVSGCFARSARHPRTSARDWSSTASPSRSASRSADRTSGTARTASWWSMYRVIFERRRSARRLARGGPSATSRDTSRSAAELTRTSAPNAVWGADGSDASAEAAPASANVAPRPRDASPPAAYEGNDAKGCGAHRVPSRENDEEDQRLRDHTNAERLLGGLDRARRFARAANRTHERTSGCAHAVVHEPARLKWIASRRDVGEEMTRVTSARAISKLLMMMNAEISPL